MDLPDLYALAEEEGIEIDFHPMSSIKAAAFPEGWIVINENIRDSCSHKFLIAHELGHILTGSFYNNKTERSFRSRCEYKANKWAIHKLVPKDELKDAINKGMTEVWELSEFFEVPFLFMKEVFRFYKEIDALEW